MSKLIKVTVQTGEKLDDLRTHGETYSEVIDRLLLIRGRVMHVLTELEFLLDYDAWKRDELLKIASAATAPPVPSLDVKKPE